MSITETTLKNAVLNKVSNMLGGGNLFTTGKVFYVDSVTGSNGNIGDDPAFPKGTVDGAVNACRANKGDIIVVMPNHAETITAASIALDVAGITVVNLGNGKADQPTYTYSAAASDITVGAADITWIGGYFIANKAEILTAFQVNEAKDFVLEGVTFEDTSSILNFLSIITTTTTDNDADGLTMRHCRQYGLNTTPLATVSVLGDMNRMTLEYNFVDQAATSGAEFVTFAAKDSIQTRIRFNDIILVGATGTTTGIFLTGSGTAMTGIVEGNNVASLDTTAELIATAGTGLTFMRNYYTGTADKSGKLWPVVDGA